jgi:mRNA interferase MazF
VSFQQPSRGQVYKANLNPPAGTDPGHEYAGDWKIVLVLQIDKLNRATSTVVVVPLTTTLKHERLPTSVFIERVPGNVLTEPCVALCHQVRALDKSKLRQYCGQLPTDDTERVAEVVAQIIGSV